jgi:YNFM family putative membrane transporter
LRVPEAAIAEPASLRPIVLLGAATFVSMATLRVADALLPQIAAEFSTTPGAASIVATAYTISYGLCQVFFGTLGDRFGKYTVITVTVALSVLGALASAAAPSLAGLAVARFVNGSTAGAIIPLAFAYIGDAIPYERRQALLGRFISRQMLGLIFGQAAGGVLGEYLGWRSIFLLLGALYLIATLLLYGELRSRRVVQRRLPARGPRVLAADYLVLLKLPEVQLVLGTALGETMLFYGSFVYLGADLRSTYGMSYAVIGGLLACFGLGGLVYAAAVKLLVARLGERGLATAGGVLLAAGFAVLALQPVRWSLPLVIATIGTGFYMLHNTLQVRATQMAPERRGLALSSFATCNFLGQSIGIPLFGWAADALGYAPIFVTTGVGLLGLAAFFRRALAGLRTSPQA